MTPELQTALNSELERRGINAVDPDVWKVLQAPDDLNVSDARALADAANKILEDKAHLFRQRDWQTLDEKNFAEQERKLKDRLSRPDAAPENIFKDLDTALLSPEQESALRRHLSGRSSKYDRSILRAALASQRQLLGGDAA
jgi:hypothetical protein